MINDSECSPTTCGLCYLAALEPTGSSTFGVKRHQLRGQIQADNAEPFLMPIKARIRDAAIPKDHFNDCELSEVWQVHRRP